MENYGEFKHDHVSLYLICVTMHYSPGVTVLEGLRMDDIPPPIYHAQPKLKHGIPDQGCYVLRATVFSDKLEACFNAKMVLNRLDYGINDLVFTKMAYII